MVVVVLGTSLVEVVRLVEGVELARGSAAAVDVVGGGHSPSGERLKCGEGYEGEPLTPPVQYIRKKVLNT